MDKDSQQAPNELWYRIDAEDRITSVSPQWLDFASENDAPELHAEQVVNRAIYRFIADPETRHLYGAAFEKVRNSKQVVRLPFRCDSPALRRYMEISISEVDPPGELELSTRVLKLERRADPLSLLANRPDGPRELRICSWCEKIRHPEKGWVDVDEAVTELRLFDTSELPALYPATCPACLASLKKRVQLSKSVSAQAAGGTTRGSEAGRSQH